MLSQENILFTHSAADEQCRDIQVVMLLQTPQTSFFDVSAEHSFWHCRSRGQDSTCSQAFTFATWLRTGKINSLCLALSLCARFIFLTMEPSKHGRKVCAWKCMCVCVCVFKRHWCNHFNRATVWIRCSNPPLAKWISEVAVVGGFQSDATLSPFLCELCRI